MGDRSPQPLQQITQIGQSELTFNLHDDACPCSCLDRNPQLTACLDAVNGTANVGEVCQFENRDSHGPSFAILPHAHYLGAAVYLDWETDDLARPAELQPPYHATNSYHLAYLLLHLEFQMLWTLEQEGGQYFEDSLERASE